MTKRVLLGVVMLLVGGTLAFGGVRMLYRAWASERWPEAKGSVLASSVETRRSKRSVTFQPHVRYGYTIGSEHFTSENIAFTSTAGGDLSEAKSYVSRYPAGAEVTLRYSPTEPSLACLECGRAGMADYVVVLGGLAMAVFAAWGLQDLWRSHRNARRRQQRASLAGTVSAQTSRG